MTTKQIIQEQMKSFDYEFVITSQWQQKEWRSKYSTDFVKAFIHSYTRKLIESLAEEIKDNNPFVHECGKENGCDICLKEDKSKKKLSLFAKSFIRGILNDNVRSGIGDFIMNMNDKEGKAMLDDMQKELDKRRLEGR